MKRNLKEPIQLLKKTRKFEEKAIIVATAIKEDSDSAYKYSAYVEGENKPCREAVVLLLDSLINDVKNDLDSQLALIKFFETMLKIKKKAIEEEAKNTEKR